MENIVEKGNCPGIGSVSKENEGNINTLYSPDWLFLLYVVYCALTWAKFWLSMFSTKLEFIFKPLSISIKFDTLRCWYWFANVFPCHEL